MEPVLVLEVPSAALHRGRAVAVCRDPSVLRTFKRALIGEAEEAVKRCRVSGDEVGEVMEAAELERLRRVLGTVVP